MDKITYRNIDFRIVTVNTVVVGSGAAGLNAAGRLRSYGMEDLCLVTERLEAGTSRNTGSDKQTYYKLTLSGGEADSVREMAETLFNGKCVDGDMALCEAALSAPSFLRLCQLGVPFPQNRYGEYIGYKTDHDPRRRATSAGPYTSRLMTEALESEIKDMGVAIYDGCRVISIITSDNMVKGLICLNLDETETRYTLFNCSYIIYATGGPAGMYSESVYPASQHGASGVAFAAGASGCNLTEWQYGLASVSPRWNVSGSYMQVLPRFVSIGEDGSDEKEFLLDYYDGLYKMLPMVFKKGYEWPFDSRKVTGSSYIDLCVYTEIFLKKRKVFLDFTQNSGGIAVDFDLLGSEAGDYLKKAGATQSTPLERLMHMNKPAYDFYLDKGVDLKKDYLEISFCAQHNNGGLKADIWWQNNIKGLFPVGEAAGSHGVYRPGGSALNAGQAGSTRAALYISKHPADTLGRWAFFAAAKHNLDFIADMEGIKTGVSNIAGKKEYYASKMSRAGGAVRVLDEIKTLQGEIQAELADFFTNNVISGNDELPLLYGLWDSLTSSLVYLFAMCDYIERGGKSRGSALYYDKDGTLPDGLPEMFRHKADDGAMDGLIQEVAYKDGTAMFNWRAVTPIPDEDDFFENVWRGYRENGNVY